MSNKQQLAENWRSFVNSWLDLAQDQGLPVIDADPDWPSPCEMKSGTEVRWQPIEQSRVLGDESLNFQNIEQALDIKLDSQYQTFFTLYFADRFNASHEKGQLQYLQAWSVQDFERLQQNLIGHLMMKSKLKQPATLFFAVTDEDDLNIVIENDTGKVSLEYVGKEPHQVLANSLAEFIADTTPVL